MYKKIVGVQGDALKNTEAKRLAKKNNNLTHTHTHSETKTTKRDAEKNCISGLSVA